MLHYGNNSSIAFHSTFGLKKFKHPLCTLLVRDSYQNAIHVAWIITSCFNGQDIPCWMVPLVERIRMKDARWKPNAFLIDDPSFEISILRDAFQCRVILCLRHIRRSWMKSLPKKCCSLILQQEMFMYLGHIISYSVRDGSSAIDAIEEFMQIFVDQFSFMEYFILFYLFIYFYFYLIQAPGQLGFMEYFRDQWLPRIASYQYVGESNEASPRSKSRI